MTVAEETAELTWPLPRSSPDAVPEPYLAAMREGRPLRVRIWNGATPWLIARHDQVCEVLKDPRFSADVRNPNFPNTGPGQARVEGGSFHRTDGEEHKRGRRAVNAEFTAARMTAMRERIGEIIELQIDALLDHGEPADFVELFAAAVPAAAICEVLGVPYEEHRMIHWAMEFLASLTASEEEKADAFRKLFGLIRGYAERKLEEPRDDLLSRLVRGEVETGQMTMKEVVQLGVLMIGAGHHTTVSMLSLGALSLIRDRGQRQLLLDGGLEASKSCTEELLRYWSIVHTEPRRVALEDVEIGGQLIRAGEAVVCSIPAANRDPRAFTLEFGSLEQLNIMRPAKRSLAFGFGVHQCIGQHLSRVEMQEAFPRLFRRLPELRLAVAEGDLDFDEGALVLGLRSMPVAWS